MSTFDIILQQGIEQGREQGIAQGREQGIAQGREQGLKQGVDRGMKLFQSIAQKLMQGATREAVEKDFGVNIEEFPILWQIYQQMGDKKNGSNVQKMKLD